MYLQGLWQPDGDTAQAAAVELGDQRTKPRDKVQCEMRSRRSQSRSAQGAGGQGRTRDLRRNVQEDRETAKPQRHRDKQGSLTGGDTSTHWTGRRTQVAGTAEERAPRQACEVKPACWAEDEGRRSSGTRGAVPGARHQQRGAADAAGARDRAWHERAGRRTVSQ